MAAISLHGLSKQYGSVLALRGIDLEIAAGEVFGFLGPNGAGKSTTIDILLGYTHPTGGTVSVLGHDVRTDPVSVRKRVGVLPDGFTPFETMTGRQHVAYAIDANDADDDPDELLERVGIATVGNRQAARYSKGMAQRLALAMALVGDPDILVLDEPSTGLDPHGVRRMREIVTAEVERGATVFFSSHILEQVEALADRVGILRAGELVAVDTIDGLRETVGSETQLRLELAEDPAQFESVVAAIDGVSGVTTGEQLVVTCRPETKVAIVDEVRAAGATILDFTTGESSLEDLFVSYTGAQ